MIKIFRSSSIGVSLIQLISTVVGVVGLFYFPLGYIEFISILIFYFLYCGIGIGLIYHRFFSHKVFEFKNSVLKFFFILVSILAGRGSPIGWVHVHREHHGFSDTDKDPHSPKFKGFRIFFPHLLSLGENFNIRLVKDLLTKDQRWINNFYFLINFAYVLILYAISSWALVFIWAIPIALTAWMMSFSTYFNHTSGYQNFETKDNSKNNWFFGYLMFGEGWHNNHHKYPKEASTRIKFWELDIIGSVILFLEKLSLIKLNIKQET